MAIITSTASSSSPSSTMSRSPSAHQHQRGNVFRWFRSIGHSLSSRYMRHLTRRPLLVKSVQSGVIFAVGDVVAQFLSNTTKPPPSTDTRSPGASAAETRKHLHSTSKSSSLSNTSSSSSSSSPSPSQSHSFDFRRTAALGIFGLCWSGPFAHYWFNAAEKIVKATSWRGVAQKVALDQFVVGPPSTALFFVSVGALQGHSFDHIRETLRANYARTQLASWAVWPAIQSITFSVIPVPLRPLFSGCVSLCWSTFVSWSAHHHHKSMDKEPSGASTSY